MVNNTYPPTEQKIGVPFATQPIVQILDYYGLPLKNKYVVAVSWPEPFIPLPGVDSYQNAYYDGMLILVLVKLKLTLIAHKFAYLSGDVSEPSDEHGYARFKNLTVIVNRKQELIKLI